MIWYSEHYGPLFYVLADICTYKAASSQLIILLYVDDFMIKAM